MTVLRVQDVLRELRRQGWVIVNGGSHRKAIPPGGLQAGQRPLVLTYGSKSSEHLSTALRKDLRRLGRPGEEVLLSLTQRKPHQRHKPALFD